MLKNTRLKIYKPQILFRNIPDSKKEKDVAFSFFPMICTRRTEIPKFSLVIGRYSVVPFYEELANDLEWINSKLINSSKEYNYISSFDYYHDVKEYTPTTYFDLVSIPNEGPFIVKGKINSKKNYWNKLMFAKNRTEAIDIALKLQEDSLIESQGIIVRQYVPLEFYEKGLYDLPFSNEHRFFFYKDKLLSYGYYWDIAETYIETPKEAIDFANSIAKIISKKTNFFTLDVAKTEEGNWILIEANDGQMSGLSNCSAYDLYSNLKKELLFE